VVLVPPGWPRIFIPLTEGMGAAERRAVGRRALIIASLIALFFLLAGDQKIEQLKRASAA